jgi:DNA invertase Pin-like site-specific DNA recombinase
MTNFDIHNRYRRRKFVIYCRQSTPDQVQQNEGSTEFQRAQREFAPELGWAPELIDVNEDDLGLTGSAAAHRAGYQRLLAEIRAGIVGAVGVTEHTRLSRNFRDWLDFLELVRMHDVLLFVGGKLCNTTEKGELFTTHILALAGEYEHSVIRDRMRNGVLGKLHARKAVTYPPVGYVSLEKGTWVFDTDASVETAIRVIFRTFLEQRSCSRTVKALKQLGVKIPARPAGKPLRWVDPTVPRIRSIVRNRRYCGDYIYREQIVDPRRGRNDRGHLRVRPATDEEMIIIEDHHQGYITRAEWKDIRKILRLNAPSAERRHLGEGSALLQGVIRCGIHGQAMSVAYKPKRSDGGASHLYFCIGDYRHGGPQCGHFAGRPLDGAVVDAVLEQLSAPSVEALRAEWMRARNDVAGRRHLQKTLLNKAQQNAADLEVRFLSVNPANHLVKEDLEAKLEAAKREVKHLEVSIPEDLAPFAEFTDEKFEELLQLAPDVRGIFYADTTTFRDRKELVRRMIRYVVVERRTPEAIHARIVWAEGEPELSIQAFLFRAAYPIIDKLAADGISPSEVADRLNAMGLLTARRNLWSADSVRAALHRSKGAA